MGFFVVFDKNNIIFFFVGVYKESDSDFLFGVFFFMILFFFF